MTREMIVLLLAFASCIAWTGESEPPTTPCDLTVYDRDRTLVQEKRRFDVTEGASRIVLPEVPPAAEAASIRFKWPAQAGIEVLEQNLEYDLVNPNALLLKYLGKEVELHMRDGTKNSGQLLYFDESVFIVRSPQSKTVDLVDRFENVRQVRFLELPENLSLRPSLVCQVNSKRAGPSECDMSYVTHQFDWRADYIAVLDAKDQELELSSWVSLNNKSGTTYNAGRVRVATDEHHYDLPRPTVVRHNQLKQVRLFPTVSGIKGEKRLIVGNDYLGCSGRPLPVRICVRFANTAANHLGFALPAGVVRVQKADADGRLEFIGQDSISHVPPDEFVDLRIGRSSDVVAEQKCVNIRRLSDTVSEFEEEITVRNHKTEEVSVLVNLLTGYNTELAAVPPGIVPEKQDALSWRAPVKVPPGKDGVTVRFTVRQVRTK